MCFAFLSKMTCQEIVLQSYVLSFTPDTIPFQFSSFNIFWSHYLKITPHKLSQNEVSYLCSHLLRVHSNMPFVLGTLFPYQKSEHPPSCNHLQRTLKISVQSTNIGFKFQTSHPSVLHQIADTGAGQCICFYPKLETAYVILTFKLFLFMFVTAVLFFSVSQTIWMFHSDEHTIFWAILNDTKTVVGWANNLLIRSCI